MSEVQATGPVTGNLVIKNGAVSTPIKFVLPKLTLSQYLPIGTIMGFLSGTVVSDDWVECDGNSFDSTLYPSLSALLGGNTTPNLSHNLDPLRSLVGVPIAYPKDKDIQENYLLCNGASFNVTMYPELETLYPNGVLPDYRNNELPGQVYILYTGRPTGSATMKLCIKGK